MPPETAQRPGDEPEPWAVGANEDIDVPATKDLGDVPSTVDPSKKDYEPEKDRERVRGNLAYCLFGLLACVSVLVIAAAWFENPGIKDLLAVLSTVAGLFGSAIGFYYGSASDRARRGER